MTTRDDAHAAGAPGPAESALFESHLPLPRKRSGKVRDLYDLPPEPGSPTGAPGRLLMVATDRLSAFDVVLPTPIPGKGRLLTAMSRQWFGFIEQRGLSAHHALSFEAADLPGVDDRRAATVAGRVTICRACRVVPIECVVRGYLDGSGWREYEHTGAVCGVRLPKGLARGGELSRPIFTPATKAQAGEHDENITFDQACAIAGGETMEELRRRSLAIYAAAHEHARSRGLILADTKFEFGFALGPDGEPTDELLLIDEALTPDSSRYWPAATWRPGGPQPSFDKQFVREHLQHLADVGEWNKQDPGPELPPAVVEGTLQRYREALEGLWGGEEG